MNAPARDTCAGNGSGPSPAKRLLVVDDHPVFRLGICCLLKDLTDITICGEAENAQGALQAMRSHRPDMVTLDVSLPGTNGIELVKQMLAEEPGLIVLMVSIHDESLYALRALRAGAKGYVMKQQSPGSIIEAVRKVMSGGIYVSPLFSEKLVFKAVQGSNGDMASPVDTLSDRELEVLQLMGRKKSAREIAADLHLSVKTIETHRAHIKKKLGFREAGEMAGFAEEWIECEGQLPGCSTLAAPARSN